MLAPFSGVQFDSRVVARTTDEAGEASLELRLPLTVADLSTFSSLQDSLLFPHVSHVRAALLGSCQAEESAGVGNAARVRSPHLRSAKWRMRHFFEIDGKHIPPQEVSMSRPRFSGL